jgi:predicted nucleotide-binding protein (sugar kinase/HSP70/actin superfamily)
MSQSKLEGRTIYIPQMSYGGARCMAAAFQSIGLDGRVSPDSDAETLKLSGPYTCGDECLPARITLGDFLKVTRWPGFDPSKTAFFMPTAGGPCRFGQYGIFIKKVMDQLGYSDVMILSPSSSNGYAGIGDTSFIRTAWRALVASDILQKVLLKTRPYEVTPGDADTVYEEELTSLCGILARRNEQKKTLDHLVAAVTIARDRFRSIPLRREEKRPLIGVVGEIFCRLNDFSNENVVRKIEEYGGEAWISDIVEWIWYTVSEARRKLHLEGRAVSTAMLGNRIRSFIQKREEHRLLHPFKKDFKGYEEPEIPVLLKYSQPYLPHQGCLGEMVLSVGKAIYLYHKGADGIADISPFTCMNGIICEAVYPRVSRDFDDLPIRTFYFDGTASDLDRDMGIFIEMARNYQRKKQRAKGQTPSLRPSLSE